MRANYIRTVANSATLGTSDTAKAQATRLMNGGADCGAETWYRTASKVSAIVPVEVSASGKGWLDIVTSTGAIQRTRTDGADSYWPAREQAIQAVRERLDKAVLNANTERRKFLLRERLIA